MFKVRTTNTPDGKDMICHRSVEDVDVDKECLHFGAVDGVEFDISCSVHELPEVNLATFHGFETNDMCPG